MEIYQLPEKTKKLKRINLRKLRDFQVNTNKQLNELRKTIHEQNDKFNKKTDIIKTEPIKNAGAEKYNECNEKCKKEFQPQT